MAMTQSFLRSTQVLFCLAGFVTAASATADETAASQRYVALLERVESEDRSVDFAELRLLFTQTDAFSPYSDDSGRRTAMRHALLDGENDRALELAASILETEFVDIEAHIISALAHVSKKDVKGSIFYSFVADGLIRSILKSGIGTDIDSPYVLINVAEEHRVLEHLRLEPQEQALVNHRGANIDQITARRPVTGEVVVLYFNVDLPFKSLGEP